MDEFRNFWRKVKLRILQVLGSNMEYPSPKMGAVEKICYNLSKNLVDMGHDAPVVTRYCGQVDNSVIYLQPKVRYAPSLSQRSFDSVRFSMNLNEYLKHNRFDIIHQHGGINGFVISRVVREAGAKVVLTIHNLYLASPIYQERIVATILEQTTGMRAHGVTVETEWMRRYMMRWIHDRPVTTIPLGVPEANRLERCSARLSLGIDADRFVLLFVGRIMQAKGVLELVRAFDEVCSNLPTDPPFLAIVGPPNASFGTASSSYFDQVMQHIHESKFRQNVAYFGFGAETILHKLYSSADAVCVPSLFEATGLVALEAMSFALPVIATRTGGLAECVRPRQNGLLVEPGSIHQLSDAILYLYRYPEQRKVMGSNALQHISFHHSWRSIAAKFIEFYDRV